MTTISAKNDVMTLINMFTVEPANQRRLVELLTEATEVSVRRAPGFVSASLHRSTDGTKVTVYAQWQSIDDYQAMRQDPAPLPFLQEALTIAKFEPGVYEVVRTFTPAGRQRLRPGGELYLHQFLPILAHIIPPHLLDAGRLESLPRN
jgi:quinol monooxygenase YgiN